MKRQFLFFSLVLLCTKFCLAQKDFDSGYIIADNDDKIECLIRNADWRNNPETIEYTLSPGGNIQRAGLSDIKEFGIYGFSRYIRAITKIDKEPFMTSSRNPVLVTDTLFLKVLVDGSADLYQYTMSDVVRYFYSVDGATVQQLIFREYRIDGDDYGAKAIARNISYQQQLLNDLKCGEPNKNAVTKVQYRKDDLARYFESFNRCVEPAYKVQKIEKKRDLFNLKIAPGVDFSTLTIDNAQLSSSHVEFGRKANFRLGLEAEIVLPYNKGKWAIIVEPAYQSYSAQKFRSNGVMAIVDYQSVEMFVGGRFYAYKRENSGWYLNAGGHAGFDLGSTLQVNNSSVLDVKSRINLVLGTGLKLGKFTLEGRATSNRNILSDYRSWNSAYSKFSLILGFQLL